MGRLGARRREEACPLTLQVDTSVNPSVSYCCVTNTLCDPEKGGWWLSAPQRSGERARPEVRAARAKKSKFQGMERECGKERLVFSNAGTSRWLQDPGFSSGG